jgi:hypothetical protein
MVGHKQRTTGDQLVKLGFCGVTGFIPEKQALLLKTIHFLLASLIDVNEKRLNYRTTIFN